MDARRSPDPERLAGALAFAAEAETPWSRNLDRGLATDTRAHEPRWNEVLGPTRARGGPSGLILRGGERLVQWGEPDRVDMAFSVTKSFLALLTGIALGDGLIGSLDDPMREYALDDGFDSPHNRAVTWRHMLWQTSEWEGTLWGKPDLVDRNRQVGPGADNGRKGEHRDLGVAGSFYEYNDVRVNRLSLSLLQVFRRALPEVLAERIMGPIGASASWAWHAYRNAWFEIDGRPLPSVPGGGHWGGGLFISCEDLARVGRLVQLGGAWEGREILPSGWAAALREPCPVRPDYGFLFWLNRGRRAYPSAPASSYFMVGAGSNVVWIDDDLDVVVVMRWVASDRVDALVGKLLAALG